MARIPIWSSDDGHELWDKVKLGGATLPGSVDVRGSVGLREDIIEIDGGTVRVNTLNYRPAEVEVVVAMWEQEHLDKYKEIVKLYAPKKDGERRPLEVLHPNLELFKITQLYIYDIGLPEKAGKGEYTSTISLREFWEVREKIDKVKGVDGPAVALASAEVDLTELDAPSGSTPPPATGP